MLAGAAIATHNFAVSGLTTTTSRVDTGVAGLIRDLEAAGDPLSSVC